MKLKRKLKRTTRQYIIVVLLCMIIIGGASIATFVLMTEQMKQEYEEQLEEARQEKLMNQRSVYVAEETINAGDIISEDLVKRMTVYASQPEDIYMGEEDMGKTALLNIEAGTHLLGSMLTDTPVSDELREIEYNSILVNSNINTDDYIDVRIMFHNGEDYIILSKKVLRGYSPDTGSCLLWLTEEEILRMASAVVDAYLYRGAKLYTTKYIEPNLQAESYITYKPSISTLILIQDNPNIIKTAENALSRQVRKAMENRLAASLNTKVEEIDWALSTNEVEKNEELPAALDPEIVKSYQEEQQKRSADIDYGP